MLIVDKSTGETSRESDKQTNYREGKVPRLAGTNLGEGYPPSSTRYEFC
jgi:hypothetical protein